MSDRAEICEQCGAAVAQDAEQCPSCGAHRAGPADAAADAGKLSTATMMFSPGAPPQPLVPAFGDSSRVTSSGIADPPRGALGRTMLGMPLVAGTGRQNTLTPASPVPAVAPPGEPSAEASTPATAAPSVAAAPGKLPQHTMLGMPLVMPAAPAQPAQPAPPAQGTAAGAAAHGAVGPAASELGARERAIKSAKATLFSPGGLTPELAQPAALEARSVNPARTMFDVQDPGSSGSPLPDPGHDFVASADKPKRADPETDKVRLESRFESARGSSDIATDRPPTRRNVGPVMLGVLALLLALGAGAYQMLGGSSPAVSVKVVTEGGVESMVFDVAGLHPGARLRFGGQEQPLDKGGARFRLGADSLQVGDNVVVFDVLETDGQAHPGRVTLSLDYRVTVDPAPLQAGANAVDVVVAALVGSRAWLDGEELALDASGRGHKRMALDPSATEGAIEHVVSYRVQPPGREPQLGQLRTPIRITSLRIDRPGHGLITDASWVEIAGAVPADGVVTVDGEPVASQGGRFVHRRGLPEVGEHGIKVTASAPGMAPRVVELVVERVADLAAAASRFPVDAAISYARVAQNPAIYVGQKAAFEGRIYNVSVENGRSTLQLLVRDCPGARRCALWVSYGAATELTVDRWVRALGTLAGEQMFRAENDKQVTVPKLEAALLVPIEP